MLEHVKNDWTIVVVGRWNTAIFNPDWLRENNIFESTEFGLEFAMVPSMPMRITADNIALIPYSDKLIAVPEDLEETTLLGMESKFCKILNILEHTPVTATGINFAYKVSNSPEEIMNILTFLFREKFSEQQLVLNSKEFRWSFKYEDIVLNLRCTVTGQELYIKFNFHSNTINTEKAFQMINNKLLHYRDFSRVILESVFDISVGG